MKHQTSQQCGGGDGGVVGAGEFGVGEQGVEEAAGEVVTFDPAGALDGVEQGLDDWQLSVVRAVQEHIEDIDGEFEDGHVVDLFADVVPGVAKAGNALVEGLPDGRHVVIRGGEAILKGEGVEEDEAADA